MDVVIAGSDIRPGQGPFYAGGMTYRPPEQTEPYVTRMARLHGEGQFCGFPTKDGDPCRARKGDLPACNGHMRAIVAGLTRTYA